MKRDVSEIMPPAAVADAGADFPDIMTIGFKFTDVGNGARLAARYRDHIRYVHPWSKWLIWDGRRFAVDDTGCIDRLAKKTVLSMYAAAEKIDDDQKRAELIKHAHASSSARAISAMVRLATSEDGIPVRPQDLDRNPLLLCVENGVVDLRTAQLGAHRQQDLITKLVPISYSTTAQCPIFERFLSDIMSGNASLISFLKRATGYTLTGLTREQVLFFGIGTGSNGKTTFLKLLLRLLGEYAGQAAPALLMEKRGETHPTEQADLFGKRLAVCTEVENGRAWAEVTVKQLTGEDTVKARRMREDFWDFEASHKFWIAANHKPVVRGTDYAIWRRLLLIPFAVTFDGPRKDPELIDKLTAELPGILRWAVDGCLEWQRRGLQPPAEVLAEVARYREEMDVLGTFLGERCRLESAAEIGAGLLYKAYVAWCDSSGERSVKQRVFGQSMTERGFDKRTLRGRPIYLGITLLAPGEHGESGDDGDQLPGSPPMHGSRDGYRETRSPSSPPAPRGDAWEGEE